MDKKHPAAMVPAVIAGTIFIQTHHPEILEANAAPLTAAHLPHPIEEEPEQQIPEMLVAAVNSGASIRAEDVWSLSWGD
jgi:hypothetical protein